MGRSSKQHEKLPPLKAFDYKLVSDRLSGLLINVDRDIERRTNEVLRMGNDQADRQLSLLHLMIRFAQNSYKAAMYLGADTPPDPARSGKYILIIPTINRQLLDMLFSLVYMLDDFPSRSLQYQRAAYRELREEDHQFRSEFGNHPDWKQHFKNTKRVIERFISRYEISEEEIKQPQKIPYWKHPYELKDEKTQSRQYLRYLDKWLYADTSAQAHLSYAGLFRSAPILLGDVIDQEKRQPLLEERVLQQYRFQYLSRTAFIVLAIAAEMDKYCSLGNRESVNYLWVIFSEYVPEAKELWQLRYKTLYAN